MSDTTILHGDILWPGGEIRPGILTLKGSQIASLEAPGDTGVADPGDARVMRAPEGGVIAPGLIDIQVNGAFGYDFTLHPDTIPDVARGFVRHGVTSFLPTIITAPLEAYSSAIQEARRLWQAGGVEGGSQVLGLHFEGPYLNPAKKGAHPIERIRRPDPEELELIDPEVVRLVTLAPEQPGALDFIRLLVGKGITVGLGHSDATYDQAMQGISAGARWCVHLFNAMRSLHHREPGLVGAMLADRRVQVGLIPDGIHVHPALLTLTVAAKGPRGVTLTSDSASAAGMPPGEYDLGGQRVRVEEDAVRLPDGTLAGSAILLDQAVRLMVKLSGCSLADALVMATASPARTIGAARKGQLSPGFDADLVVLDADYQVESTIIAGELVYSRK